MRYGTWPPRDRRNFWKLSRRKENWTRRTALSAPPTPARVVEKMTLPPTRPLGQTLVLSAMVIGTMALGAVILWAATHGLWLVVHQGLH